MKKDRLVIGIICLGIALWILLSQMTLAPVVTLGVLGIWGVATARRR